MWAGWLDLSVAVEGSLNAVAAAAVVVVAVVICAS